MIHSRLTKIPARACAGGLVAVTILFAVSLQACLTGGGGDSGRPDPVDYVARGEEFFRQGRFAEAMAAYDTALLEDSSRSLAYLGHAKAALAFHRVDWVDIHEDVRATSTDPSAFAFLDHPDSVLTGRLQGAGAARRMLHRLADRDSLTTWWLYADDALIEAETTDPLYPVRRAFMIAYLGKADLGEPGYRRREAFPLTDFKVKREAFLTDLTYLELVYTITRLYDLDGNDTIDARDSLMKKLKFGNPGGFAIDSLKNIADDLDDSSAAQNLNDLIAAMQSGLRNSSDLANLIQLPDSTAGEGDTTSLDPILSGTLGGTLLFYQFGDGKDNDGDGCVDEEILDEKDNDLDGFVDEDARIVLADQLDNDRDGATDGAPEDTAGIAGNAVKPWLLGFVNAWTAANPDSSFIRIPKGAANMALRVAIQKDSLAAKSPADLAGPYQAKLDSAKALMGGCWRNYP